jgi:transcriptional regulator with XRE-family HTH domain
MKPMNPSKRHTYTRLGKLLRDARRRLCDEHTGRIPRVEDMAKNLGVTAGFVYQVEHGKRKPKDGKLGMWASVYGVRYVDLCKCLDRIPMDLVASLKEEPQPVPADPFSQLTEEEKSELLPFLNFVRWKLKHKSSASHERP